MSQQLVEEAACSPETDMLRQDILLDTLWVYVPAYFSAFLPCNRVSMRNVGGGNHTPRVLSSVNLGTNYLWDLSGKAHCPAPGDFWDHLGGCNSSNQGGSLQTTRNLAPSSPG